MMRIGCVFLLLAVSDCTLAAPVSGLEYLSEANRAMQEDEFSNPGYLWVDAGRELFEEKIGANACADCHPVESMAGVSLEFPKYDQESDALMDLTGQINECRVERQQVPPLDYESQPLLSLLTFLNELSRGLTIDIEVTPVTRRFFDEGKAFYYRQRGQLNLSCAQCHEQSVGKRLRGEVISEGHLNGYPAYRHIWETLGSVQRMFRWCNEAVRAEPWPPGSPQYINLEYYLKWRADGLRIETPAVRR
ncbi:MAG: sulfur oxidation c-type cytochrome SoxA [Pseudomonadales bacterium]|nr:sulfur oxidation c-type cytochrome SoxA [Pseudomonadales bacterium]